MTQLITEKESNQIHFRQTCTKKIISNFTVFKSVGIPETLNFLNLTGFIKEKFKFINLNKFHSSHFSPPSKDNMFYGVTNNLHNLCTISTGPSQKMQAYM